MRYMKVLISGEFIIAYATEGKVTAFRCLKGLPENTKFCYAIPDTYRGIWLVVENESFPELKDGDLIPEFEGPLLEKLGIIR